MAASAYTQALNLLAARPYTTHDLKRKLALKAFPPEEIEATTARLLANGLLDDTRYATQFARGRLLAKGSSKRHIIGQLSRKGIPREISSVAVDQVIIDEEIDTISALDSVARRKLASMGNLDIPVLRRRLYGFLARRGYDVDEIRSVTERILREGPS